MKRMLLYASASAVFLTACAEPSTSPPAISMEFAVSGVQDSVATPMGWLPRSCVHMIENGAVIDRNHMVTRRNGTRYQLVRCGPRGGAGARRGAEVPHAPTNPAWIMTAWADNHSGGWYKKITANWTVPAAPTAVYPNPPQMRVYYTFPGLSNNYYIIQPVLQYGYNGWFGGRYWTIASWHCHDAYDCDVSATHPTVAVGAQISGRVEATNCGGGNCTWTIVTKAAGSADSAVYSQVDNDDYNWVTAGAVEVYNFNSCSDYPPNGVSYTNGHVYDGNGSQVYPVWNDFVRAGASPSCAFSITHSLGNSWTELRHNPTPVYTSFTTNPAQPIQYIPTQYVFDGQNFDPVNSQIVLVGDSLSSCFVIWNIPCEMPIMDNYQTRTSTRIAATANGSYWGPMRAYLRNLVTGHRSPYYSFRINPMYPM